MSDWRATAKTIAVTAIVTSAAWLIGGALLFERLRMSSAAPAVALALPTATPAGAPAAQLLSGVNRAAEGRLVIPVSGVRAAQLVDTFSQARAGGARVHDAIDIMAPTGTPVVAAAAGRLEKLFLSKDGGNTIYIRSPDGRRVYYYAHLDSYAGGLVENQTIAAGQAIGTVGYSGNANPAGPHLHFAIFATEPGAKWYTTGTPLNPYPLLVR